MIKPIELPHPALTLFCDVSLIACSRLSTGSHAANSSDTSVKIDSSFFIVLYYFNIFVRCKDSNFLDYGSLLNNFSYICILAQT